MSKNTNFADIFSNNDFSKLFENYQNLPFDMKDLLETQRRNVQALSNAQQIAIESMQTIAQRQTEILSQMVEDNSSLAKEIMSEGTPEEKMSKNTKLFKTVYERTVTNLKELSDILNKSNMEASDIINKRVSATLNEIQSSLEKPKTEKSQKKAA